MRFTIFNQSFQQMHSTNSLNFFHCVFQLSSIIVLAADISPVDILTHLPLLAEEASCPYIVRFPFPPFFSKTQSLTSFLFLNYQWVTSKEALGVASSTKRPTSCVMIAKLGMKRKTKEGEAEKEGLKEIEEEFQGLYEEMIKEVAQAVSSIFPLYCFE